MNKDYYSILGVQRHASRDEIKAAFKRLAREHHPDVAKNKTVSESKFKEINEAYEILGDPSKRQVYDEAQSKALVTDLDADATSVVEEYFTQFNQQS